MRLFHSQLLAGFDRRTLRFTIRDLLLVTAIVALSAGFWLDHRQKVDQHDKVESELKETQLQLKHKSDVIREFFKDDSGERRA